MKLLFLDMDGVINCETTLKSGEEKKTGIFWWERYDEQLVKRVYNLCEDYDFKIICSSTWRNSYDDLNQLKSCYERIGLNSNRLIGITPSFNTLRREEIRSCISSFLINDITIDLVVVIDDEIFAKPKDTFQIPCYFCHTSWGDGYSKKVDKKVRKFLENVKIKEKINESLAFQ